MDSFSLHPLGLGQQQQLGSPAGGSPQNNSLFTVEQQPVSGHSAPVFAQDYSILPPGSSVNVPPTALVPPPHSGNAGDDVPAQSFSYTTPVEAFLPDMHTSQRWVVSTLSLPCRSQADHFSRRVLRP